jgi:uncharacterized protein YqjF (DUF2071 family)
LTQQWRELTFLHWPVPPAEVAPLMPPATVPDIFDGVTWVGLVAFRMWRIGPGALPGLPYFGTFPETNVRLYSVDGDGRRGVVFRSLEAARLLPVLVARSLFALPYMWSGMEIRRDADEITYLSRRRWPRRGGALSSRLRVRIGTAIEEPTPFEDYLTARWGLHVDWHGRTLYLPNAHPAWPLHRAEIQELDDDLVRPAGLPGVAGPPASVLYSPGVPVRFGPPVRTTR